MESDTERSIVVREDAQGSNATALLNSSGSTVKINSLSIDLGIVKEKGDHAQKCSHFSIRGYAAKMRERGGNDYLPFAHGSEQDLPPIEVPRFRYWLCQSCLQDSGAARTSQEVALVSRYGKSMVQPCATCYSTLDCHGLPILPFGEGTSGLKPADKRNDDERLLTVLQGDTTQSAPNTPADVEEPDKVDSIDTNVARNASVSAPGTEGNDLIRDLDDSKQVGTAKGTLACLAVPSTQPDQLNDDQSGHPRRKARKVRLLTELLCGSTDEQHQRKENSLPHDLAPSPSSSPLASLSQIKRKIPQAQDRRSVDVTSQGHVGKKVKTFKGDASVKTSPVGHSRDQGVGHECGQNTDKYQCKKHGTQRSSKLGNKVGSDPVAAWRSIFSDMGRADKQVSVANGTSEGRGTDAFSKCVPPPPQPEKKSNASKKILENSVRNQLFDQEDMQRTNVGGSRVRDRQSDVGLGLGLSLHYDPQSQVPNSLPQMPNRVPIQDHSRKAGFFFGDSSIAHRVTSDPQSNARSVYEVRDGHSPRTAFLQEQQQQHYHAQLSHASFSQHQNLDFSDPHNKRNGGIRGYTDIMRAHNHHRQEMFSNGRSDEKEIVELMAKIQHERNLSEARSYCVPGGSNNNGIPNASSFHKVNFNEGMPIPLQQQYPTMRRPPPSSSMMPTGENSLRNPVGFYHQERFPAFPMFDTFSQCRKQPPNGIRVSDPGHQRRHNSHYHEPRGNDKTAHQSAQTNMQIMEAFSKYHDGTQPNGIPQGNVWSNIPSSMPFGHNMEMHTKWSNRNKGKSVINLDLNVMAPNVLDEQNHLETSELNHKHMGSLDSSYSNEAIPAMQLLSLMDAGKSSLPYNMAGKKFNPKPFSCNNHCSPSNPGKPNAMEGSHFPYPPMQSGVKKPVENSRHFNLAHGTSSPSMAVTNSFSSLFHTDQTFEGRQSFHKPPPQKKQRVMSSGSVSHKYRPEESFAFPLPWHTTEDPCERVAPQGSTGPRNVTPRTEICTINQNPADFSTPGPENVYMIDVEDLKFRGERCYKSKFPLENADGVNRQKKS